MSIVLGTTIGGGSIHVGAVDEAGKILAIADAPLEQRPSPPAFLDRLDGLLRDVAARAGASLASVEGIGVAAPGQVDGASGAVIHAPNLGWVDVPLGQLLRERYPGAVAVENDANAAALGEAHAGAGKLHGESRNLSFISVDRKSVV